MIKSDPLDEGGFQMDSRLRRKYIFLFPHDRKLFLYYVLQLLDNAVVRDDCPIIESQYARLSAEGKSMKGHVVGGVPEG